MGFISEFGKAMKKEWAKMQTSDKVKIVIRLACSMGSGFVTGALTYHYIEKEKPSTFEAAMVTTAAVGLAWKASDVAYDAWEKVIDMVGEAKGMYNDLGDEMEQEEVVG